MRKELASLDNTRGKFTAVFVRYGSKSAFKSGQTVTTLLLKNIQDENGKEVTDHIWFTSTKAFEKLSLKEGEKISFEARVKTYTRGYKGLPHSFRKTEEDFKLSHPTKIERINA